MREIKNNSDCILKTSIQNSSLKNYECIPIKLTFGYFKSLNPTQQSGGFKIPHNKLSEVF